jgi:hypothetical protein
MLPAAWMFVTMLDLKVCGALLRLGKEAFFHSSFSCPSCHPCC